MDAAALSQLVLVMQHLNAGIAGAFAASDRFQLVASVAEGRAYVQIGLESSDVPVAVSFLSC